MQIADQPSGNIYAHWRRRWQHHHDLRREIARVRTTIRKVIVEIIEPLDALTSDEAALLDGLLADYGLGRAGMVVYTVRPEHEPRYKLVAPHIAGVQPGTTIDLTVSAVGGRAWRSYYWEEGAPPPSGADQPLAVLTIASGVEIVADAPLGGHS